MLTQFQPCKMWYYLAKRVAHLLGLSSKGISSHSADLYDNVTKTKQSWRITVYFLILKTLSIIIYNNIIYLYNIYMRIYQQAGFLPQWCIICIGKYTYICPTWEFYFLMAYTRAYYIYIYIFMFMLLIVIVNGYCDFVNFPSPVWIGQMRVVILLAFSLSVSDESTLSGYIYSYIWYLYLGSMYLYLWNETLSDCRRDCVQLKIACQWRRENFHREITK